MYFYTRAPFNFAPWFNLNQIDTIFKYFLHISLKGLAQLVLYSTLCKVANTPIYILSYSFNMKGCICHFTKGQIHPLISFHTPWIWKGVFATLQRGKYTLSYPFIPLGYERVYLPLYKVANTPFYILSYLLDIKECICHFIHPVISFHTPWIWKGVFATLQSGKYTLWNPFIPLGYERVYLPLCKVANASFHIQGLAFSTLRLLNVSIAVVSLFNFPSNKITWMRKWW